MSAQTNQSNRLLGLAVLVALAGVTLGALWAITSYMILGGLRHDGVWLLIVLILGIALSLAIAAWRAELRERIDVEEVANAGH